MDEGQRIRVFVADDHTLVRQGTRELLSHEEDIEVVGEAADGVEAVEAINELRPDVAVLDIAMPRMNGIEATRQVKKLRPETRILVLTAYDYEEYVRAMVEAGAAGYILKTADLSELSAAIRAVFTGEAVLDPALARKIWGQLVAEGERRGVGRSLPLSPREHEVLILAGKGLSNKEIALTLNVNWRTVQAHLDGVFSKLGVASRTEAVVKALQEGCLRLEELA